jgi:putative cell wall-binding protein
VTPPPGAPVDNVQRIDGETRLETAIGISQTAFDRSDNVVLARVDDFPDALAAGGLATELDAPVLLTPTDGLDDQVAEELERLGVQQAYLAGGPDALSEQVEADLSEMGIASTRLGGAERFETAALVAREIVEVGGPIGEAIVALGGGRTADDDWPDALASATLSGAIKAPVVLVAPEEVPEVTAEVLGDLLDEGDRVYIAGGTAAVGEGAQRGLDDAGYVTQRLAGADRYGTAVAVVEEARARGADPEPTFLVTGTVFADALVGGPAAHRLGGVLLLVDPQQIDDSAATRDFLSANRAEIDTVYIAGGTSTISENVAEQVRALVTDQ